jgi:hypothetical protein
LPFLRAIYIRIQLYIFIWIVTHYGFKTKYKLVILFIILLVELKYEFSCLSRLDDSDELIVCVDNMFLWLSSDQKGIFRGLGQVEEEGKFICD